MDYEVMAQAFASHKELGRLADENIYQADVAARLRDVGFRLASEVPIVVSFDDFIKTYYLDCVVNGQAVYEWKAVTKLAMQHEAQLMNYLLMLGLRHGKMVNFRPTSVESRFVNATMGWSQRKAFSVVEQRWKAPVGVKEWIVEMLRDWGVGLELPLYHQAIVHRLGGESRVTCQLPIVRDGVGLGNHRFHLVDEHSAFRVTAHEQPSHHKARDIARLVRFSPLRQMHWINISRSEVLFSSLL